MTNKNGRQRWVLSKTNEEFVNYISRLSGLSPACSQVLINRGIKTPEQIRYFFSPQTSSLSDPYIIAGMTEAVNRIRQAISRSEKILLSGDYDADGLTATAIMLEGLRSVRADVSYFIPHRLRDGYGFGLSALKAAADRGASLIITVDSGITSFDALAEAKRQGIDVIVTDHHEPERDPDGLSLRLPDAYVIVNPKVMPDTPSPYNLKDLSGAGVAFKLVQALCGEDTLLSSLFDLAAIGTSADVVSVLGENRIILDRGLKMIHEGRRPGIAALKDTAGIKNGYFKNSLIYFAINPRINAPGRIDDASSVIRLFSTQSYNEALDIAKEMCEMNTKRQQIEEAVYREAISQAERLDVKDRAIVVASEGWHLGVVGIVASRLVEAYSVPAFVFTMEDGIAKGSARSNGIFNLLEGLKQCEGLLERFGGHKQAAGISLRAEHIDLFRRAVNSLDMLEEETIPSVSVDALVNLSDINEGLLAEISTLEPFGHCNREPLFASTMLEVVESRVVGNNHLRMNVRQNGRVLNCIAFDMGSMADTVSRSFIDALFVPASNKQYNSIQLQIRALRQSRTL